MTTRTNGQVRKTLASQRDRLDSILDGLSEGLNEAVATAVAGAVTLAVRQAVRETLQAVIAETLTNPDLLAALRGLLPTAPPDSTADPPERRQGLCRRVSDRVKVGLGVAGTACAALVRRAAGVKVVARAGWQLARQFRGRGLAACGVGMAAGALTLWAAPPLGVAAASVVGFFGTLAVQARNALRRLFTPAFT